MCSRETSEYVALESDFGPTSLRDGWLHHTRSSKAELINQGLLNLACEQNGHIVSNLRTKLPTSFLGEMLYVQNKVENPLNGPSALLVFKGNWFRFFKNCVYAIDYLRPRVCVPQVAELGMTEGILQVLLSCLIVEVTSLSTCQCK